MLSIFLSFSEFNSNYWWVYLIAVFIISLSFLVLLIVKKKEADKIRKQEAKNTENLKDIYDYLGGDDNVISHELKGTRLTLVLKDYQKVNREKLKEIGVERVLSMANKYILVGESKDLENINKNLN